MRTLIAVLLLSAAALAGFLLGRVSGAAIDYSVLKKEIPLFAPPPKTAPYELPPAGSEPVSRDFILETPVDGTVIDRDIEVAGRAPAKSGSVTISIKDGSGTVVAKTDAELGEADPASGFARFARTVSLLSPQAGTGAIEVVLRGADGAAVASMARSVVFVEPHTVAAKVYFGNSVLDGEAACGKTFPAERQVSSQTSIYRAVIDALLSGPTEEEKKAGFFTLLPAGVKLKSVAADAQGIVTVDFTSALVKGVAGSCRVSAIRAQIEATVRQFPEVRGVVIAVEERVEDVLQP